MLSQTLVCLILISLSIGFVSPDEEYSLAGLKFVVSPIIILVGGCILAGCLLMLQLGLVQHEDNLRNTILRLYYSLGYMDESMYDTVASPLESPSIIAVTLNLSSPQEPSSFLSRMLYRFSKTLIFTVFLYMPIVAQLIAGQKLITIAGWKWWLLIPLFVLITSVGYLLIYFRRGKSNYPGK
jgi:hypothetical protein